MKRKICLRGWLVLLFIPFLVACGSSSVYEKIYPTLSDGKYDSEFPYKSSSAQLEEISQSVKLVTSVAFYTSYVFPEESRFTSDEIRNPDFKSKAVKTIKYNNNSSGTATVIFSQGRNIALLTCAHVVSFADTIITYYSKEDGTITPFIQSVSLKEGQNNYIPEIPERGYVDIIVMDKKNDIALIGKKLNSVSSNINIKEFPYPNGKASELEWGDFVYVFGYPMNFKMISKALVSSPDHAKGYSFLVDAVFNRGSSGGIVLAIRDGVPNFELVGIVRSVPAESEFVLLPLIKDRDVDLNPQLPYRGDFVVEKRQAIKFGITKVIGIEAILDFFKTNRTKIEEQGFFITKFLQD